MALSIGVRKDQRIRIGTEILTVVDVQDRQNIRVSVEGRQYTLREDESCEIAPEVRASVGSRPDQPYARIAFEAPRRIAINRIPAEASP